MNRGELRLFPVFFVSTTYSIYRSRERSNFEMGMQVKSELPTAFAVIDFETTGLSAAQDEIIEIGAIRFDVANRQTEQFSLLVKTNSRLPGIITSITGITDRMLALNGVNREDAFLAMARFLDGLPLVAYNASFDMGFLRQAYAKHRICAEHQYTCALQAARLAWPGLQNHKLETLARHVGLSLEGNHRAVHDCERTLSIFLSAVEERGVKMRWRQLATR
jgi:DNA polymerase III epsilon subunit family exonuclease